MAVLEDSEMGEVTSLKDMTSNASLRHAGGVRRAERRCQGHDVSFGGARF